VSVELHPALILAAQSESARLAFNMLVIFGSAKLMAELLERMRLPGIVGEILAGVLIGPSVFGLVTPDRFTAAMAGLGVMYLLFQVGLEVDASELLRLGGTTVLVGTLGVALPFAAGWALYILWGKPQIEAVFLGTALTATSVGISAQVLAAKGLLERTAAKIILGAAVVDDILALLLLGVASSLAEGRINLLDIGLTSLFALAFVLFVAHWGRKAMNEVVPRLEKNLRLGEGAFALAMILLFALAALSVKAGVAAIIGAFLAGMALGEALPRRVHDLAHGITELLVPFFLASIGMHLNLAVFREREAILLALLVVPIAIGSKLIGCGLGALHFGPVVAARVGFGMIPRGEFCLVVAQAGLTLKTVTAETYAIVVFMAVVVAALTPLLLRLAFRAALAGQDGSAKDAFRVG
jgi:Kef-type K+ transport system membrane component KefB